MPKSELKPRVCLRIRRWRSSRIGPFLNSPLPARCQFGVRVAWATGFFLLSHHINLKILPYSSLAQSLNLDCPMSLALVLRCILLVESSAFALHMETFAFEMELFRSETICQLLIGISSWLESASSFWWWVWYCWWSNLCRVKSILLRESMRFVDATRFGCGLKRFKVPNKSSLLPSKRMQRAVFNDHSHHAYFSSISQEHRPR